MRVTLCLILSLVANTAFGAGFGDIPASLAMPAGQAVRRNAGDTAFEAFTPGSGGGSGTVTSITATAPIVVTPSPLTTTGVVSITGAALTKTDDTNVTLTLGGAPSTALLGAASITAGWTGTLANSRGGFGADISSTAATTVFGRAAGTSGAPTFSASPQFTAIGNLTTNGFVKTGGGIGTLSVDTTTYQASSANLTTWSGIAPGTNVGTFLATPSSANLRGALTDENGTGAALFSGATTPDFTTGFTIGAAAASGKILIGNGTNYVPSTPTWPTAASTAGKAVVSDGTNLVMSTPTFPNASATLRKIIVSDGTNWLASTETWAVPGTSGNMLKSDGTNWISFAGPTGAIVGTTDTQTLTNKRITKRSLALAAPTPAPSINADTTDVVHITGLTGAITSITMTGTPVEGDTLRIDFTDNGTARALAFGANFEAGAAALPTTTTISTRLDTIYYWNTVTSKWRCQASSASPTYPGTSVTSGKILISDGTNFVASTATFPSAGTNPGYEVRTDGTNVVAYPDGLSASSTTTVSSAYAADTYLAGSMITVAAGDWKAQGQYRCEFDMTKTGAGVAAFTINVRMGTAGTTADPSVAAIAFAAGTGVVDTGIFTVYVNFRTVGSGTSAVVQATAKCEHHLAATGLVTTGASGIGIVTVIGSGFNSTTQTKIGISVNGGASFVGTNNFVQSTLRQP